MRTKLLGTALALALFCAVIVAATVNPALAVEPADDLFTGAQASFDSVTYSGDIAAPADCDWYYFYLPSSATLAFRLDGAFADVYEYRFGYLVQRLPLWGGYSNGNSLGAGLYYVRINYPGVTPSPYQFTVYGPLSGVAPSAASTHRLATPYAEASESGFSAARTIQPYANNQSSVETTSDVDWYKFSVTAPSTVSLGLWGDAYFALYRDPSAPAIFESNGAGYGSVPLQTGTHYVCVRKAGTVPSLYTFAVQGTHVGAAPLPAATVLTPHAPTRMRHGRSYTVYGYLKPRHAAGTSAVKLYCYRYQSGHYVLRKTVTVKVSNYSSYSKYSGRVSLPYTGKWRIKAGHSDSGHRASYSGYDYVRVY